jgi:hypothetical protein
MASACPWRDLSPSNSHTLSGRAKARLGIASRRSVEPGASAHWAWELPKQVKNAKDAKKYRWDS